MGAIVALLGNVGDPELGVCLDRMLARSPYRGTPQKVIEGPLAIGIQSMGWDASLASTGNWIVAFHGYIGNWEDLREERSWRFRDGASDAVRIAIAYEDMGTNLFAKLRGEWAIMIWGRNEETLVAARDPMGCRTLYWQETQDRCYVATEIRQVQAGAGRSTAVDLDYMGRLLLRNVTNSRQSIRKDVCRLGAGHWAAFRDRRLEQEELYWELSLWDGRFDRYDSFEEAAETVAFAMRTAVQRAIPDRPFSVALSGGLDSSGVWGWVHQLGLYGHVHASRGIPVSYRFPGLACDEGEWIRRCWEASKINGMSIEYANGSSIDRMEQLAGFSDTPFFSTTFFMVDLAEASAMDGRSCMLTGLGGDGLFIGGSGYLAHEAVTLRWGKLTRDLRDFEAAWGMSRHELLVRRVLGPLVRPVVGRPPKRPPWIEREVWKVCRPPSSRADFYRMGPSGYARRVLQTFVEEQRSGWLVEALEQQVASRGVEVRHPLLDVDLVSKMAMIPPRFDYYGGLKRALQRAAIADVTPSAVSERSGKAEFSPVLNVAASQWLKENPSHDWALVSNGLLDEEGMQEMIHPRTGTGFFDGKLHLLIAYELFMRRASCSE